MYKIKKVVLLLSPWVVFGSNPPRNRKGTERSNIQLGVFPILCNRGYCGGWGFFPIFYNIVYIGDWQKMLHYYFRVCVVSESANRKGGVEGGLGVLRNI